MPPIKLVRLAALSCLIACGDPTAPPPVTPDAPPDIPPPENMVFVELFGSSPVFVRYRTGDLDWQEPVDTGDGYELMVYDDYELVAACANEFGSDVGFFASTFEENDSTYIPCFAPQSGSLPVQVTGTMTTPGSVYLNRSASGETPNWSFELDIPLGTHDLIAIDADRALVQRDIEVLGETALPAIDTTAGAALVDHTVTTNATTDELVSTGVLWFTGNSGAFIPVGGGTSVKLPPASLLGPFDQRYISVDAALQDSYRSVYLIDTGNTQPTIDVEFLPQLSNVAFVDDGVLWTGTLEGDDADLYFYKGIDRISISASAGWLANRNKLSIDTEIPGFDPAWRITNPDYRSFSINDSLGQSFRSSAVFDLGSSAAAAANRDRANRRRSPMLR